MKVIVVGGGIAGLAAAHRVVEWARERGPAIDLTLFDAADRLGGTIRSERRDGFLVECGPDSFLSEKPWALALCRRLGIEDRLIRTDDRFRRTFVAFRGRLHPLPDGFQLLAPTRFRPFVASRLFSWPGKLRMALDLALPRGGNADESLGAFVRRRLGKEALERVAQPLVAGIYTADPDDLALAATMPRFLEMERRERSVILAMWRAARRAPGHGGGIERRPLVAVRHLRRRHGGADARARQSATGGAVRLGQRVTGLPAAVPAGGWPRPTVESRTPTWSCSLPEAYHVARMLRLLDPALAHLLEGIPYASSATVTLAYRRADIATLSTGSGSSCRTWKGGPSSRARSRA